MVVDVDFSKIRIKLDPWKLMIWWCKLSSCSSSWYLLFYFSIKFEIIILKHKFSQLIKSSVEICLGCLFLGLLIIPSNQAHAEYYHTALVASLQDNVGQKHGCLLKYGVGSSLKYHWSLMLRKKSLKFLRNSVSFNFWYIGGKSRHFSRTFILLSVKNLG